MTYHDAQRLNAAIIAAINIADEIGKDVGPVTHLLHDARRALYVTKTTTGGMSVSVSCSSVMQLEVMQDEMIAKTIASQKVKLDTVRTLIRQGLPVPSDLNAALAFLCVECGRDLNGYKNFKGICRYCAGEAE